MILGAVKSGDAALADHKTARCDTTVLERHRRELAVEPIDRRVSCHAATAPEVISISRRRRSGIDPGVGLARRAE